MMRCSAILLAATSGSLWAGELPKPRLVKDINRSNEDLGSFPQELTKVGGTVFFRAQDPAHGHELWKTDGTVPGTVLVKDLIPGSTGGFPRNLTAVGNRLFFTADNPTGGAALWSSDGSPAGTTPVIELSDGSFYVALKDFTGTENRLFFTKTPQLFHRPSLYASDGTAQGTVLLNPIDASDDFSQPFYSAEKGLPLQGGSMVFPANDNELWISDGSVQGTRRISALPPGNGNDMKLLGWIENDLLIMIPGESADSGLWTADLANGQVMQVYGASASAGFKPRAEAAGTGNTLFFTAEDDASGAELWASDGTAGGTRLVMDIWPGQSSSNPRTLTATAGRIFFIAESEQRGPELWSSDGTAAGTRRLSPAGKRTFTEPRLLTASGNGICFVADGPGGAYLWKSDGRPKGTVMLKKIADTEASYGVKQFTPLANRLLFCGSDGKHGSELWTSNGTPRGTRILANIATGTKDGYNPFDEQPMATIGDQVYFRADDGIHGEELWETDGTAKGTHLVQDLVPGKVGGEPRQLTTVGDSVFFVGYDPENQDVLWKTGNTKSSTRKVIDLRGDEFSSHIEEPTAFAGQLFFTGQQVNTDELWASDGTPAGTSKLQPGGVPVIWPSFITELGGELYFAANLGGPGSGEELWHSDGTAAGTAMLKDLRPGPLGSSPSFLVRAGSRIFFRAFTDFSGIQLWKTDGGADGTVKVTSGDPWSGSDDLYPMIPAGEDVYFFADDGEHGSELWKSDGTSSGTFMVKDINPAGGQRWDFGSEDHFAVAGDILYFLADDGAHGEELWRSDGTAEGTTMVKDIFPGSGHSRPADMIAVGNRIYFSADDGSNGREWWTSDGTAAGTQMVADLSPGSGGSNPSSPFLQGKKLYFSAVTPAYGSELWVMDGVE